MTAGPEQQRRYEGTPVVPGIGHGPVVRPSPRPVALEGTTSQEQVQPELERFVAAALDVAANLNTRAQRASGAASEVLVATAAIAEDRALPAMVKKQLKKGVGLEQATAAAFEGLAGMFKQAGGVMADRVTDLYDIRDRIVAHLQGVPEPGIPIPAQPSVLLADDLAPADTAGLDPSMVVAIATELGGATSHTAIISRQLGIPCVVGVCNLGAVPAGTYVLVDGKAGTVELEPDIAEAEARAAADGVARKAVDSWRGPGATADGVSVQILANVQDGSGAKKAAEAPVEGVGLFRTELCFLNNDREPSVDEQASIYGEVLEAMGGRKVVVRTLDAGSDKPLAFATIADEPNPALGVRGARIAFKDAGIMDRQLDAIAKAAAAHRAPVWVMAPMIATVEEARWFATKARERGLTAGVMVEVPAAAVMATELLAEVDFVSIGTNDLSQYTFAADRMASSLAGLADPFQPALLRLISAVAEAGSAEKKPVGVCGEAAADPLLGCVLAGLGVTSLSAAVTAAPAVGAALSTVTMAQCRQAASAALATTHPTQARAAARRALNLE